MTSLEEKFEHFVAVLGRTIGFSARAFLGSNRNFEVIVLPEIDHDSEGEVPELIHKLRWYLPDAEEKRISLNIVGTGRLKEINSLNWLGDFSSNTYPVKQHASLSLLRRRIVRADLILVWRANELGRAKSFSRLGEAVLNVDKQDPDSQEYGRLASLHWDFRVSHSLKKTTREHSLQRLKELKNEWDSKSPDAPSFVVTTGPSYAAHEQIDSRGSFVIACNSIVSDANFFDKHNPNFFIFADGAHHAGASKPSSTFRMELHDRLEEFPDFFVMTTDKFSDLFKPAFSKHWDRFLFFQQSGTRKPVINIIEEGKIPSLDSVLTIHMLPLAFTFTNKVFLIGADGIRPNGDNEDFWPHERRFRYAETVDLVHKAHPTFEYHRSFRLRDLPPTKIRYESGLENSLRAAELKGKQLFSLTKSFTKPINERYLKVSEKLPKKVIDF